jgi:hypothetical protein
MSTTSSNPAEYAAHRFGPGGMRAHLRHTAIEAAHQINAQLLDLLCAKAASVMANFPFDDLLRARFAVLTLSQRERLVRCGTLLVDLGFSDPARWRQVAQQGRAQTWEGAVGTPEPWLLADEAVFVAHSTLLVAWSVLQGARAEAGVLLGTAPETAGIVSTMSVNQLSGVAQRYAQWVRPRWMEQPRVWSDLLDFAVDPSPDRSGFGVLRCWQASGGQARWLDPYFDGRG